ncbi:MAG: hypothetical protein LBB13_01625 [Rickettsiales bacterium]|jgi:hypothetical protein|nr:hypothetical protein [Rickettsiales bacterium]
MFKGKFYVLVVFSMFLCGVGVAGATSVGKFKVHNVGFYLNMKETLTAEKNKDGSYQRMMVLLCAYHDHPDDEDFFHCTVGSYICGDEIMKRVIEKELKGVKGAADIEEVSKGLLAGTYGKSCNCGECKKLNRKR